MGRWRKIWNSSTKRFQWVGGGRYGTPVPRDYSKKQNRKERQLAIRTALTEKVEAKELIVLDKMSVATPKTNEMINILKTLKLEDKKVLLVVKEFDENLILATRNIQNLVLILADEINVLDIVGTDVMVATEDAIKYIEEVLK